MESKSNVEEEENRFGEAKIFASLNAKHAADLARLKALRGPTMCFEALKRDAKNGVAPGDSSSSTNAKTKQRELDENLGMRP
jgi:hypothetical protein